jgi:predicted Holliday junction resolvase-like endonuclease
MIGIILLVLLVIIAFTLIAMYNTLVQLRVRCDSAWSDIDVQLKRRHDLIPNLRRMRRAPSRTLRSSARRQCRPAVPLIKQSRKTS